MAKRGFSSSLPILCVLVLPALPAAAFAGDSRKVSVMDRCEPESFDDAVEPGTCVRTGGVTFDKFVRQLNPQNGGHTARRFGPDYFALNSSQSITATNTGGETHTFYGGGELRRRLRRVLNVALPPGTPPAQPLGNLRVLPAGATVELDVLSTGTHLFECLITRGCGSSSSSADRESPRLARPRSACRR